MKVVLIIACVVLIYANAHGASLTCDPQTGVVAYDVTVDGIVVATDHPAQADGSVLFNVDAYGDGIKHQFILVPIDASGWRGPASAPFDAEKPDAAGGVRVIN
jgi:hypothetical protein